MEHGMECGTLAVKWDMDSSARCPPLPQTRDLLKLQLCLTIVSPITIVSRTSVVAKLFTQFKYQLQHRHEGCMRYISPKLEGALCPRADQCNISPQIPSAHTITNLYPEAIDPWQQTTVNTKKSCQRRVQLKQYSGYTCFEDWLPHLRIILLNQKVYSVRSYCYVVQWRNAHNADSWHQQCLHTVLTEHLELSLAEPA